MHRSNIHHVPERQNFPPQSLEAALSSLSQVFLGASVHGYIFIGSSIRSQMA